MDELTAPEAPILVPEEIKEISNPTDLDKLWQEYLQKCCEVGQIRFQLEQLESQRLQIEKQLDVTEQQVRKVATKHRELQKANMEKLKIKPSGGPAPLDMPEPKLELTEVSH